MMGRRQKLKGGDEWDAVSKSARRIISSFKKAGRAKYSKIKMNRRDRKDAKSAIKAMDMSPKSGESAHCLGKPCTCGGNMDHCPNWNEDMSPTRGDTGEQK